MIGLIVSSRPYSLKLDRRLQHPSVLTEIANRFALPPGTYVVRSDAHYRT